MVARSRLAREARDRLASREPELPPIDLGQCRLDEELERLARIPLLIVDEVGYIPFDPEAAALSFALVSSRSERRSLIVSSNKTFSAWAEIFGDPVAVAAMVDRLLHHAEVIVLKGESYRLRGERQEVLTGETDP